MRIRTGTIISALVFVALLGLSVLALYRVRWDENLLSDLPDSSPELSAAHSWLSALSGREPMLLDVDASACADAEKSAILAADRLIQRMEASGDYQRITSGLPAGEGGQLLEMVTARLPRLLDPADYPRVREKIGQADRQLQDWKAQAANPFSVGVSWQAASDPLGLAPLVLEKTKVLADQKIAVRGGRFFSPDGKHLLILAWPKIVPSQTGASGDLFARLDRSIKELEQPSDVQEPLRSLAVRVIGAHRSYLDNASQIKRDVAWTSTLALISILITTLLAMSRPWLAPVALLPSIAGVSAALALVGLFCNEFSLIVVGTASALLGVLDDYGLHLLHVVEREPQNPLQAAKRIRLSIFMAAITTGGAFATLYFTHFPGQYRLATFSLLSIASAALFAVFALPHLLPASKPGRKPLVDFETISIRLEAWREKHSLWVTGTMLLLILVAGLRLPRLIFEGNPEALNALTPATRQAEKAYGQAFGDPGGRLFVFQDAPDQESLLQSAERLDEWIRQERIQGGSLAVLMPSQATQVRRLAAFEKEFGPGGEQIVRGLQAAARRQGFNPAFFKDFESKLRQPAPALTPSDLEKAHMRDMLEGRLFPGGRGWVLMTPVKPQAGQDSLTLSRELKRSVTGATLVDKKRLTSSIMSLVKSDIVPVTVLAFLLIGVMVFLSTARIEMTLVVLTPLAAALVLTFGSLAWLGIPVNLINLAAAPLIFGLGADYSLFRMESALARYRGHEFPTGSVLSASLTTLAGFGALAIAGHPALHSVGVAILFGIFWSLVTSLTIVPTLMAWLLPKEQHVPPRSLKTLLGGTLVMVYLTLGMLVYALVFRPLFWVLGKLGFKVSSHGYLRFVCWLIMFGFPYGRRIFLECDRERFPEPCIVVANHESQVDIMMIMALRIQQRMLVKPWVWKNPITGPLVRGAGFLMTNGDNAADVLAGAKALLASGVSVMIFPEGSRSKTGEVQRFHKGAFQLAVETGVPVVPVVLAGTRECVRDNSWVVGPHTMVMHPLPAIDSRTYTGEDAALRLSREAKRQVVEAKRQLHPLICPKRVVRQQIQERFAYLGPAIENTVYWKMKLDPLYSEVDKLLPASGRILDLGCGYGLMGHWAMITGPDRRVLGVDADHRKIEIARETVRYQPGLEFVDADILEWAPEPAEIVLMLDVLHYWGYEKQAELARKAASLVQPGGRLIFRDACLEKSGQTLASEHYSTAVGMNKKYEGLYFRPQESWVQLFEAAGFRKDTAQACGLGGKNVLIAFTKR